MSVPLSACLTDTRVSTLAVVALLPRRWGLGGRLMRAWTDHAGVRGTPPERDRTRFRKEPFCEGKRRYARPADG